MSKSSAIPWVLLGLSCIVTMWAVAVAVSVGQQRTEGGRKNGDNNQSYSNTASGIAGAANAAPDQNTASNNQDQANEKNPGRSWQTWFNVLVGLATAAQAVLIFLQVKINSGQHATQRAELRAYVWCELVSIPWPDDDGKVTIHLRLIHTGPTPAVSVSYVAMAWCASKPAPFGKNVPAIDDRPSSGWVNLFPSHGGLVPNTLPYGCKERFTREDIDRLKAESHCLLIGIRIVYKDMFEAWHTTLQYYAFDDKTCGFHVPDSGLVN